jgi:hypothetical protein
MHGFREIEPCGRAILQVERNTFKFSVTLPNRIQRMFDPTGTFGSLRFTGESIGHVWCHHKVHITRSVCGMNQGSIYAYIEIYRNGFLNRCQEQTQKLRDNSNVARTTNEMPPRVLFLNECHRARTTRVLPAQRGVTAVQGEGILNLHKIDVHFDAQHIWQK